MVTPVTHPEPWTLFFCDLVDSTGLIDELGDMKWAELSALHDGIAREIIAAHGGREIDKTDGFLVIFRRPIEAVQAALEYHENLAGNPELAEAGLKARVGIHYGEVILRTNEAEAVARGAKPVEVDGLKKPKAARIMALGQGGQTLLTRAAYDMARRAAVGNAALPRDIRWLEHGMFEVQGCAIHWRCSKSGCLRTRRFRRLPIHPRLGSWAVPAAPTESHPHPRRLRPGPRVGNSKRPSSAILEIPSACAISPSFTATC